MTLPIDMTGAVWFVSQAIWEWEDVPVANTSGDSGASSNASDNSQDGTGACDSPEVAYVRELVFKGFSFDTRYNWVFNTDSPLAHPWEDDHLEDARQHAHRPAHQAADEAPTVQEVPPATLLPPTHDPSDDA